MRSHPLLYVKSASAPDCQKSFPWTLRLSNNRRRPQPVQQRGWRRLLVVQQLISLQDSGEFIMEVRQRDSMDSFCSVMHAIKAGAVKGRRPIGDDKGRK